MASRAIAFSNNDIAVFAWCYDEHLKGCLGFAIHRGDVQAGTWAPLPAFATFKGQAPGEHTTEQAPVQKFWWKDLGARRGGVYRYRIVPLGGAPGHLVPLEGAPELTTNVVSVTHDRGLFKVYFNRGIIATPAVTSALGTPSADRLERHIGEPKDPLRQMLSGEIEDALEALLSRAETGDMAIRGALYELKDPKGLEVALHGSSKADAARRAIILGNERESSGKGATRTTNPDADSAARVALEAAGAHVIDRILPDGHIPHNKFLLLKDGQTPAAVLTGSCNWTSNALCAQTNNALLVESKAVASHYAAYWDQLEKDSAAGNRDGKWQGEALRTWNREHNERSEQSPEKLEDGSGTVSVFFSPSTKGPLKSAKPEVPGDMEYLFKLIQDAKQAVLFLAFDPGNNSILDAAGKALRDNKQLFVRGALTSPVRAENFAKALGELSPEKSDESELGVGIVSEAKTPGEVDFRAIPAGAVTKNDAFGNWEAELKSAGHAIIHDKIVVIDPFSDDCTVVLGSHNLGYRASSNNDENFIVVRGHRALAEAYACHVLDVYDHYAWRYWLAEDRDTFGAPLKEDDSWQEYYLVEGKPKSAEMKFWLSATPSVEAHAAAGPRPRAARGGGRETPPGSHGDLPASRRAPTSRKPSSRK